MIVSLDTSTPVCKMGLYTNGTWQLKEWDAGRSLAKELIGALQQFVGEQGSSLASLEGIIAYKGPGSFTGLRIGLTVLNTLADAESIPIVGMTGDDWQAQGLERLVHNDNDELVMPEYGGDPHITTPRK